MKSMLGAFSRKIMSFNPSHSCRFKNYNIHTHTSAKGKVPRQMYNITMCYLLTTQRWLNMLTDQLYQARHLQVSCFPEKRRLEKILHASFQWKQPKGLKPTRIRWINKYQYREQGNARTNPANQRVIIAGQTITNKVQINCQIKSMSAMTRLSDTNRITTSKCQINL